MKLPIVLLALVITLSLVSCHNGENHNAEKQRVIKNRLQSISDVLDNIDIPYTIPCDIGNCGQTSKLQAGANTIISNEQADKLTDLFQAYMGDNSIVSCDTQYCKIIPLYDAEGNLADDQTTYTEEDLEPFRKHLEDLSGLSVQTKCNGSNCVIDQADATTSRLQVRDGEGFVVVGAALLLVCVLSL